MANFNQTNINRDRFFFATKEEGEQDLFISTISAAPLTDFYVGITGAGGNLVQINQMPDIIGTVTTGGEEMLYAGTASTYKTLSSLSGTASGLSFSTDRIPGTGIATIESYGTNGSIKGFEFLSRGVNSELLSTGNVAINTFMSSISRPGATVVFDNGGTAIMGATLASQLNSLNSPPGGGGTGCFSILDLSGTSGTSQQLRWSIGKFGTPTGANVGSDFALFSYDDAGVYLATPVTLQRSTGAMTITNLSSVNGVPYPQNLLSTAGVANLTGVAVPSSTPTVIYTLSNANLIPNALYHADVAFQWEVGSTGATDTWIELGVRLGGNGTINYDVPQYMPSAGTSGAEIANSISQITDCGTSNTNIEVIAYHQGVGNISISTNTITGATNYFKQVT